MIPKDNAVINFIELIEKGESDYKLTSIIPNLFIDAKLKMLDSGNYEVSFVILPEHESKGIDIHYFLKNPFILFAKGQKILIQNIDIIEASETLSQHEVKIILKAFRGDIDDSLWTQSRQTAYVKYNKKEISPSIRS